MHTYTPHTHIPKKLCSNYLLGKKKSFQPLLLSFFFKLCLVCMCMYVHVCAYGNICATTHQWRPQNNFGCWTSPSTLSQGLSSATAQASQANWAWRLQGILLPPPSILPQECWDCRMLVSGDLNSNPEAFPTLFPPQYLGCMFQTDFHRTAGMLGGGWRRPWEPVATVSSTLSAGTDLTSG